MKTASVYFLIAALLSLQWTGSKQQPTDVYGPYGTAAMIDGALAFTKGNADIRITDEGDTCYVDMRSASRYGRHDLGDNAARITGFLTALDAAVAGAAGVTPAEPALPPAVELPLPAEPPSSDAPAD